MSLGVSKIKEEKINNPVLILIKSGEQLPNALCQTQVLEGERVWVGMKMSQMGRVPLPSKPPAYCPYVETKPKSTLN